MSRDGNLRISLKDHAEWRDNVLVIVWVDLIETLPKVDERSHESEFAEFGSRFPTERSITG